MTRIRSDGMWLRSVTFRMRIKMTRIRIETTRIRIKMAQIRIETTRIRRGEEAKAERHDDSDAKGDDSDAGRR